jgi:hypothetical protein
MPPQAPTGKRQEDSSAAGFGRQSTKAAGVTITPTPNRSRRPPLFPLRAGSTAAPRPVEAEKPVPKPKAAEAAPKPTPAKAKPVEEKPDPYLTRREFLNYAWLASIALFSLETVGLSLWFAFPNFKAGQFGGQFPIGEAKGALPEVNSGPKAYTDGKFWLVNLDTESPSGEPRQGSWPFTRFAPTWAACMSGCR